MEKDKEKLIPKGVERWKYIRKVAQDGVLKSLKAGTSVVYDDNNAKREHREELREIGMQAGTDVIVVYLDTPIEVIRAREEANKTSQDRHEVETKNFQKVLEDMEVPTSDENTLVFTPETNMEEFLKKIRSKCTMIKFSCGQSRAPRINSNPKGTLRPKT